MNTDRRDAATLRDTVDGIPLVLVEPTGVPAGVALWLPPFGSDAEAMLPHLRGLADAGWVAASIDPLRHGRRLDSPLDEGGRDEGGAALVDRTFRAFRAEMWQILGRTTLDAMRVLDRVLASRPGATVVVGGISMGGDIALALAGIDARVGRVAVIGSTPDWRRPGMHTLWGDRGLVDQGEPTASSAWLERHLAPVRHVDAYDRDLDILMVQGAADDHITPGPALSLRDRLAISRARVTVELREGLGHEVCREPAMVDRALGFLTAGTSTSTASSR